MAIKGEAEVPALHRSRFIFACSLRIGGHFYAIKCARASKPEPRNKKQKKSKEILILSKLTFTE